MELLKQRSNNHGFQGQPVRAGHHPFLWGVRWYVAYPISYRQLEEMMQKRSVEVDHSSLNNIVEQDRRAVKPMTRPMLGFKSFWSVAITIAGIELMHMIRKDQLKGSGTSRPAQQFYSLAS